MANAYTEACTRAEIENVSDAQEDIPGMGCDDPSPQVWPDTDEELDLVVNVASSGNELGSTYFQTACESRSVQPPVGRPCEPVSWADVVDEAGIELGAPKSQCTITVPEPCQTLCLQLEAGAGYGNTGDAIDVPLADVESDHWEVGSSNRTQPLLLNLESALSTPLASQCTTSPDAELHPSSLWLPHLLKQTTAHVFTVPNTPNGCTPVSFQSAAATPLSRASPLNSASFESESTMPQSQASVAGFKVQVVTSVGGPSFHFDDSPSCLRVRVSNRRVPAAAGPLDQMSKKTSKSKAPGTSTPSTRSTMQEGKAIGALALKKARAMLPAVNLKPSENPATSALQFASASAPSALEGHVQSRTMDDVQAVKRPLPTLLQGRQGDGMLKSKLTFGQEKPDVIGVVR
eukprot:TRINITY_DN1449_c0_g3_i1.p1 TRINITY_DN1449_c0_g3~~TRINITY_DN1449_c0_g3_i1.p1  ORF type:complete len:464 (+),score=66.97 TRINITY_DN1449_c0_g3_i1:186-1394(+)